MLPIGASLVRCFSTAKIPLGEIVSIELQKAAELQYSGQLDDAIEHLGGLKDRFQRYKGEKFYNVILQMLGDAYYYQRQYLDCDMCYRNIVEIVEALPEGFSSNDAFTAYTNALSVGSILNTKQA